jgi:hypothetical protein
MIIKKLLLPAILILLTVECRAQSCECETEFTYIKNFMEKNYAGFKDKQAQMTKAGYEKLVKQYLDYSRLPHSKEQCLPIIVSFLAHFKDDHVSTRSHFDAAKLDSAYMSQRQIIPLTDERIAVLRKSTSFEGIYDFHDPLLYKIAVIKDKTLIHDYVGIIISSNAKGWKRGMIKLEGTMVSDSVMKGVLYMINGKPKQEGFTFGKDALWGDWHREGTNPSRGSYKYEPVASRKLSDKTLYIKISSFSPSNAKNIDSILKVNKDALATTPNLVLDLRGNGGGADFAAMPLLPYVYTNPIKSTGTSLLSTEANIKGWKKYLDDEDLSEKEKNSIKGTIQQLENNPGKWVSHSSDGNIDGYTKLANPAKVIILIDKNCASTTEQFSLYARQSTKVTFMGQNTSGTLDYSNVVEAPFPCMPYILRYSSSRSRRLDKGEGIDNIGIKPDLYLNANDDWIAKAINLLEK